MKKVKPLLFIIIFLSAGFQLFAETAGIELFNTSRPSVYTEVTVPFAFKRDLKVDYLGIENRTFVDFKELAFDAGLSLQNKRFDFSTNVKYMPLFFDCLQTGIGVGYHLYRYFGVFSDHDLLLSARLKWCRTELFNWEFDGGIIMKFSDIDSMRAYRSFIFMYSYFLELAFSWQLTPKLNVYGTLKSIDYFDCLMLGTPFAKTGFDYEFDKNLRFNMDITFKFVDMITSAVYLSECVLRTGIKVGF